MTLAQLQMALIQLIRFPEGNRGQELHTFIKGFDLNESEIVQIRTLADSKFVRKFGRDLRTKRSNSRIIKNLRYSLDLIGKGVVSEIINDYFEPQHFLVEENELYRKFIEFVCNETEIRRTFHIDDFVTDLLRYEFAEFSINTDDTFRDGWTGPVDSLLVPGAAFTIESFNYDVLDFVEQLKQASTPSAVIPSERKCVILFVRHPCSSLGDDFLSEQYEINEEVCSFLASQQRGESVIGLPGFYEDLVSAGLCRPASI